MSVMPDVAVNIPKEVNKQLLDNEKPDDYDKVSRPLSTLKRVVLFAPRVLKKLLLFLWRRLWGVKPKT